MRTKKLITLVLERRSPIIHCPEHLAPFTVDFTEYEGRRVLEMKFKAFDCYFLPGGIVAVNVGRHYGLAVLDCRYVLEIREGGQVTKNRLLCPTCYYASLEVVNVLPVTLTTQTRYFAVCRRKGCTGTSNFTG